MRARFTALQRPLAFFDGPGGTQVPDSVIDAIADYLRDSNANTGGPFETSRRTDALLDPGARTTAADFLNATVDEVAFGANMTTLNFALTRTAAREWREGDEIVCTKLDHDGNISPWLELAHDQGFVVSFAEVDEECRLDLDHLRSLLSDRTRVVAFPWASNAVGTVTPVTEVAALAHEAGALAWVDAVHYGAARADRRAGASAPTCSLCSPYKFYGPHLGLAFGRRELLEGWRPVQGAAGRPTSRSATASRRDARARAARRLRRRGRVPAAMSAGTSCSSTSASSASVPRRPAGGAGRCTGPRRWTAACRPSRSRTTALRPRTPRRGSASAGSPCGTANYYAVEIMKRLGLPDGAVRIGIVHYNTADEVDRLLAALAQL